MKIPGIYVASRVSRHEEWKELRAQGWHITSTWIDEAEEGETGNFRELWQRIVKEIAESRGIVFYGDVSDAPWKGALVEVGIALALKKKVAVYVKGTTEGRTFRPIGSWLEAEGVSAYGSLDQALHAINSQVHEADPAPALIPDRRANDRQVAGNHYNKYGNLQVWDIWWMFDLNAFQASILKYVIRYRDKNGIEDLEKAKHYIDKLIELEKAKANQ